MSEQYELYGGPADGAKKSKPDERPELSGTVSVLDVDGNPHYYVLMVHKKYNIEAGCFDDECTFYAYAGMDSENLLLNVVLGHPGCDKNNGELPD